MMRWIVLVTIIVTLLSFSGSQVHAGLNDGLMAYYPFNGNAQDESGNAYHGTLYGPTLTSDKSGNPNSAYSFDGSDDYIDLGGIFPGNTFSVSTWVNPASTDRKQAFFGWNDGGGNMFVFGFHSGNNLVHVRIRGANYKYGSPFTGWHHVAAVVEETSSSTTSNVKVFLDGLLLWETELAEVVNKTSGATWSLGQERDSGGLTDFFGGIMDEVRIYNRVLTPYEIGLLAGFPSHTTDSPAASDDPDSAMYTLEDIYNRLTAGAAGTKSTGFTEPSAGPEFTMPNLNEIMLRTPVANNTIGATEQDVKCGKAFWGLRTDGTWGSAIGTRKWIKGETGPAGGIVFFVSVDGCHGKEVTQMDIGNYTWDEAKTQAQQYVQDGFDDWILPEPNELMSVCDLGLLIPQKYYWTNADGDSTDTATVVFKYVADGNCYEDDDWYVDTQSPVRPIREW